MKLKSFIIACVVLSPLATQSALANYTHRSPQIIFYTLTNQVSLQELVNWLAQHDPHAEHNYKMVLMPDGQVGVIELDNRLREFRFGAWFHTIMHWSSRFSCIEPPAPKASDFSFTNISYLSAVFNLRGFSLDGLTFEAMPQGTYLSPIDFHTTYQTDIGYASRAHTRASHTQPRRLPPVGMEYWALELPDVYDADDQ